MAHARIDKVAIQKKVEQASTEILQVKQEQVAELVRQTMDSFCDDLNEMFTPGEDTYDLRALIESLRGSFSVKTQGNSMTIQLVNVEDMLLGEMPASPEGTSWLIQWEAKQSDKTATVAYRDSEDSLAATIMEAFGVERLNRLQERVRDILRSAM